MKKDWKRKIYGGLCLTSIAFVFQACYGTPQDFGSDLLLTGQVNSKKTGLPIKGIKVSVVDGIQYVPTDDAGKFSFYIGKTGSIRLKFEDTDADLNGSFQSKDTLVTTNKDVEEINLTIQLEEK